MRDRLVEILEDAEGLPVCQTFEGFADYLIENGVVVIPCKIGEKLYHTVELLNGERLVVEGIAFGYAATFESGKTKKRIYFWASGDNFTSRHYSCWLEISEFGKTVFLTREEAERALEGGGENDGGQR